MTDAQYAKLAREALFRERLVSILESRESATIDEVTLDLL